MEDIVVFKSNDEVEYFSSKTDQDIQYENYIKSANLPVYHFPIFKEMINDEQNNTKITSNIVSVYIKNILKYCIPIICEIPDIIIRNKTTDVFNKKKELYLPEICSYSIDTQLEYDIACIYENTIKNKNLDACTIKTITIPKHTTFKIIGIQLPKSISRLVKCSSLNFYDWIELDDILISGAFGLIDFQNIYTQSKITDIIHTQNCIRVYFNSDTSAIRKIQILNKYIDYVNSFYEKSIGIVYSYIYTHNKQIIKQIEFFNIFDPIFNHISDYKSTELEKMISKITQVGLGISQFQNLFIFNINNISEEYNKILLIGTSHRNSAYILNSLKNKILYRDNILEYREFKFNKELEFITKRVISLNKFNISKLSDLSKKQLQTVDMFYNKKQSADTKHSLYAEDFNIIEILYDDIQTKYIPNIESSLNAVFKILDIKKDSHIEDMTNLIQNSKKINLICPHVIKKAQFMISNNNFELELSDYMIQKFSINSQDGHFCKICGEILRANDSTEVTRDTKDSLSSNMDTDTLKNTIWADVSYILTTYIKFKNKVNYKKIATSITTVIKSEIHNIQIDLVKVKTNNRDRISSILDIYICIYTIAVIVHMITKNYGQITFSTHKNKSGGQVIKKPNQDNNVLQNILNSALLLILHMKSINISKLNTINTDSIKPVLLKAYKWASNLETENAIKDISSEDYPIIETGCNIYEYVKYILSISQPTKDKYHYTDVDILGRSLSKIKSDFADNKYIYDTLSEGKQWDSTDVGKYNYYSFKYIVDYVKQKLYNMNIIQHNDILEDHKKKYMFLKDIEKTIHINYKNSTLVPLNIIFTPANLMNRYNNFNNRCIKLDKYYDNDGIKHKFDIYVYQNMNEKRILIGPKLEYTKSDIIAFINNNDITKISNFKQLVIIDTRCSVCNTLFSNTKNSSIETALLSIDKINNLYNYYEYKCPHGELHDYIITKTGSQCSKCGLTDILINSQTYYNKYKDMYNKEHIINLQNQQTFIDAITYEETKHNKGIPYPNWIPTITKITEITKTFNIKYNIWINLGLSIDIQYKLIETDKYNPSTDISHKNRILRNTQLYGYLAHVIFLINMIKNYNELTNIPFELYEILKTNNIDDLQNKIKTDYSDTIARYVYYTTILEPSYLSNFILTSISTIILDNYSKLVNAKVNIANKLTMYIINSIINTERFLSKLDLRKITDLSKKNDDFEVNSINSENSGDENSDDNKSEKSILELSDEDPDNVFSLNDMDIEMDADENINGNPIDN